MKIIDKIMDTFMYDEEIIEEAEDQKPVSENKLGERFKEKKSLFKKKDIGHDSAGERKSILDFHAAEKKSEQTKQNKQNSKTLNLPVANKMVSVVVLEPIGFDDSQKIADYLRNNQPVVVNFGNTDNIVAKRMTDFISGTVYAIGGSIKKLGRNILVCAPKNVDIDAGLQEAERGNSPWEK